MTRLLATGAVRQLPAVKPSAASAGRIRTCTSNPSSKTPRAVAMQAMCPHGDKTCCGMDPPSPARGNYRASARRAIRWLTTVATESNASRADVPSSPNAQSARGSRVARATCRYQEGTRHAVRRGYSVSNREVGRRALESTSRERQIVRSFVSFSGARLDGAGSERKPPHLHPV